MTAEEWRPVVGQPGYWISSEGRVLSRIPRWRGSDSDPRILRPGLTTGGYPTVVLCSPGVPRGTRYIHHLVAEAFIGPRPEGMEIRHLDGNPEHCAISNLAYGSASENAYDRVRHGNHHNARKTHCLNDHAFSELNTYYPPAGGRRCRACKSARDYQDRIRAAQRAAGIKAA